MKNILLVDDDAMYCETAIDSLKMINPEYNVIVAPNGIEALSIIKKKKIDLIMSDIQMPVMNGIEFLTRVRQDKPDVPIIMMTAFGTKFLKDKASELGALQFFEKSMDFLQLARKIDEAISQGTQGFLRGIPLPTFLQLVGMEKKSCTIIIKAPERTGHIYIREGNLIDAETEDLSGEAACYEIIRWEETDLEIRYTLTHRKQTIHESMNHILMEALRLKDESGTVHPQLQKPVAAPSVKKRRKSRKKDLLQQKQLSILDIKFKEIASIKDFIGGGVFTEDGEKLTMIGPDDISTNTPAVCDLAIAFFSTLKEKAHDMGTGVGKMIHITTDLTHILIKSFHIKVHDDLDDKQVIPLVFVVILQSDASIGLANLKIATITRDLNKMFVNEEREE